MSADKPASDTTDSPPEIAEAIASAVQRDSPDLRDLARAIAATPELGFQEHQAVALIANLLESRGISVEVGAFSLETSFVATIGNDTEPHFAVLAEYDALPDIGHACGHNVIAAVGVGAFLALADVVTRTGGRVSLIGTPAEENGGGKELILRAGGFDSIGAAGMVHPGEGDAVSPIEGFGTSGVRRIHVRYHGRAAHAALSPHLGVNALDAVVQSYQSIAALRQHIAADEQIHGIITEGGTAPNIVPETTAALYFVRANSVDGLVGVADKVVNALNGAAMATGATAEITLDPTPPYMPYRENVTLTRHWADAWATVEPQRTPAAGTGGVAASTDMGNLSHLIPCLHPIVGIGSPQGIAPHTPDFAAYTTTDHALSLMESCATALATTAANWLADSATREAVQSEFDRRGAPVRWGTSGIPSAR